MTVSSFTFEINEYSNTPKYKQIINSVVSAIETDNLELHEKLPSINEVSINYDVSRDTVEKAYRELKRQGVIDSVPGKGYYIKSTHYRQKRKVFLLFNKLSAHFGQTAAVVLQGTLRAAIQPDVGQRLLVRSIKCRNLSASPFNYRFFSSS